MKLTLYMKSGNVVVQKGVVDFKVQYSENEVVSLRFEVRKGFFKPRQTIVMSTLDLSQIECMVRE